MPVSTWIMSRVIDALPKTYHQPASARCAAGDRVEEHRADDSRRFRRDSSQTRVYS